MAKVLDAVFLTKKQVVHVEFNFLRHVVRGKVHPTLKDVANILHLPIIGNVDPFHYDILPADTKNLVFCDLSGNVKHFKPKVAKDSPSNSRKFIAFGIPKEPKSKSVLAKWKMGNGFFDIVFLFLACSLMPSQLHANHVLSL
ncbi:hypothetical protein D8674_010555 [Pyrus ussuriensis x Pyrus communis]|uniref:Uncharacterized protein n=1 Tax=Pyrus ussuriensis x Pyrus communis TaxID=2448454 RepID=A0A5N5FPV1_9ROSA|nr:hypothetical protein D8674_010555 [Pyrus ussuriensis x Pyrus communis]